MSDPDARERAVLSLMDRWPWEFGGVVIGGYAIIAYGPPRYSDDVDVVLPKESAATVRPWLRNQGLKLDKHSVPNPQNFEGQAERYKSTDITLDLMVDVVRDRDAKVDIPESWIAKKARRMKLETLSGRTQVKVPIARPEALWALKLQAGRPRDIGDLFAISKTPFDSEEVSSLFVRLRTESLTAKLLSVRSKLKERKIFVDSLSRRQMGSPGNPENIRKWARFVSTVERIVLPVVT